MTRLLEGRSRRAGARAAAVCAVMIGALVAAAPAALAESATSPNGMVSVSVPAPVVAGAASTYTLTYTNTTSETVTGIGVSANMPTGMTVARINGCSRIGGNQTLGIECTISSVAPGASVSATFGLIAASPGDYSITFNASGGEPVPGASGTEQIVGDSVTLPVSVQPGPTNIQVTGSSNNGSPPVGSSFSYTWQVKNDGPLPAFGVTLDDPLPASILLAGSVTIDNGSCTPSIVANAVHCDIGTLAVGQQSDMSFPATPTATGIFANQATVAMTGTDTQPANNSFTVTVQPK